MKYTATTETLASTASAANVPVEESRNATVVCAMIAAAGVRRTGCTRASHGGSNPRHAMA